jgi:surfeit locus 1 family protein
MRLMRGVPVGRAATIELRNQHMTYAVTWCGLSADILLLDGTNHVCCLGSRYL